MWLVEFYKGIVGYTNNAGWCKVGLDVLHTEGFMDRPLHQRLFKKYACSGVNGEFCHRWVVRLNVEKRV